MIILVDSKDYNYSTKFKVKLPIPIKVSKYRIRDLAIPNVSYVLNSSNKYLYLKENSNVIKITLDEGHFGAYQMIEHIQTKLRASSLNSVLYVVLADQKTMKITISAPSVFGLLFGSYTKTPYEVLGFNKVDYNGLLTYTSPNLYEASILYYLLNSDELSNGKSLNIIRNNNLSNNIMVILNKAGFGSTHMQDSTSEQWIEYGTTRKISEFDLELLDSDNNSIDMKGKRIVFVLEADEI